MLNARIFRLPALILAFGALVLHAQDAKTPDPARAEKRIDRFVGKMEKELKLSKEQSEKIRAILRKDPVSPHHGMGRGLGPHREFATQLRSGTVDTAALNRAFEERMQAMRASHAAIAAKFAEVHAVLTPEQREKAAGLLEKHAAKMEKRHQRKCGKDCPH